MINQQAGLGAMMQASPQPQRGMPAGNMAQTMALAKKMSDSQLAEVLAGKNMDVPQFVAMTEAMGRKQLRTAMEGAQSMGAGKQPSEKEKLLAELQPQAQMQQQPQMQGQMPPQAGVAAVPAPNMENVGMANGGIVAFAGDNGSLVGYQGYNATPTDDAEYQRSITPEPNAFATWWKERQLENQQRAAQDAARRESVRIQEAAKIPQDESQLGVPTPAQLAFNAKIPGSGNFAGAEPPATPQASAPVIKAAGISSGRGGAGAAPVPSGGVADALEAKKAEAAEKRKNYLDELLPNKEETSKQMESMKNQGQGEFLMQMGAALMQTPNLGVALGKGVQAGLPGLAASRKEINALTKDQRDYSLNLAKAQEARQQGNEEQAFKYEQLAEQAKFHAGTIAYQNRMADAYMARATAGAGGGAGLDAKASQAALSKAQSQLAAAMKDPQMARKLRSQDAQQEFLNTAFNNNIGLLRGTGGMPTGPQVFDTLPSGAQIRE